MVKFNKLLRLDNPQGVFNVFASRSTLAESLVLVGGTAMMRGFKSRLSQELKSLLATPKYQNLKINNFKLFQPPAQLNYVSWLGWDAFAVKGNQLSLQAVLFLVQQTLW